MKIFLIRHGESMQNTKENYKIGLPDHKVYLTEKGIKTAILDLTKNKDTYKIYAANSTEYREIAGHSIPNLAIGQDIPLRLGDLSVYTGIPRVDSRTGNYIADNEGWYTFKDVLFTGVFTKKEIGDISNDLIEMEKVGQQISDTAVHTVRNFENIIPFLKKSFSLVSNTQKIRYT